MYSQKLPMQHGIIRIKNIFAILRVNKKISSISPFDIHLILNKYWFHKSLPAIPKPNQLWKLIIFA